MHNDKGFTLVEVIVAMAVVAIVASSIFQMFVTSSYVNKDAQIMDIANVVAVQQAETFKADPVNYDPIIHYYGGDGIECSATQAVIKVISQFPNPNPKVTNSNNATYGYPDFCNLENSFRLTNNYAVTITPTYKVQAVDATVTTVLYEGGQTKITNNILSIRVDFPTGGEQKTITLTNDSDVEAEFYVFNTINPSDVNLLTARGASSISYVPATVANSSNKKYGLTLVVSRLNKGASAEMFRYSVNKYINSN